MRENDDNVFHKGFYKYKNVKKALESIENKRITNIIFDTECIYYYAYIFIDGICNIFAKELNTQFGYDIYKIVSIDAAFEHWFCLKNKNDKKIFIDVRGCTSSFSEFIEELNLKPEDEYNILKYNKFDENDFNDEWFNEGKLFANYIINKYYSYYS